MFMCANMRHFIVVTLITGNEVIVWMETYASLRG
jgi:hypothetical protein